MESRDAYRSELLEEITREFDYSDALDREVKELRRQVTELRNDVCAESHGAERTFDLPENYPCPRCGENLVFGFNYTTPEGQMQHTRYICRSWPVYGDMCAWEGYSVPMAYELRGGV